MKIKKFFRCFHNFNFNSHFFHLSLVSSPKLIFYFRKTPSSPRSFSDVDFACPCRVLVFDCTVFEEICTLLRSPNRIWSRWLDSEAKIAQEAWA